MSGGRYDSSLTRVQPFFTQLVAKDPGGSSWLPQLLSAAPRGKEALGSEIEEPGTILASLVAPTERGRLGCFEFAVAPPTSLLRWYVDHPEALQWPERQSYSEETTRLRRSVIDNEPAGSQGETQELARQKLAETSPKMSGWWRFEGDSMIDCVIQTDRLVITIEGKRTEPISSATNWYPRRSQLIRNLEAAKHLAKGRAWGSLLMSEAPLEEGTDAGLDAVLADSTPHLDAAERNELHAAYLGNLTWDRACEAVGIPQDSLPDTAPSQ